MQTQRDSPSLRWPLSLLLLLGLVLALAVAQTRGYREAVLRAVDEFNRQSSDTSLYRLLDLDSQPPGVRLQKSRPPPPLFVGLSCSQDAP